MLSSDLMIFILPRLLGRGCFLDFFEEPGESEWIVFVVSIVVSELIEDQEEYFAALAMGVSIPN